MLCHQVRVVDLALASVLVFAPLLALSGCGGQPTSKSVQSSSVPVERVTVESVAAFHRLVDFPVGVAVAAGAAENSLLNKPDVQTVVNYHFNSLTAENIMKPMFLQPKQGEFVYHDADALLNYANSHGLVVHGHTLLWHSQIPAWMENFQGDTDAWRAMMETHITQVAAHFAGRLVSWDVVNEAFTDDSPSVFRDSVWYQKLGEGYIEQAFIAARSADAHTPLYYNDYDLVKNSSKLDAALNLLTALRAKGVPIDGFGFQMHIDSAGPSVAELEAAFTKAVATGMLVRISELDISVNQSKQFTQFSASLAKLQEQRYKEVVAAYLRTVPVAQRGGITVWGLTDTDSWIPGFWQRDDWPLLFTGDLKAKLAARGFAQGLAAQ